MEQYLIVGGFLFWLFVAIASALLVAFVYNDSLYGALVVTGGAAMVLGLPFGAPILDYAPHTWYGWMLVVLGYGALGAIWSLFKFRIEYRKLLQAYADYYKAGREPTENGRGPRTWAEKLEQDGPKVSDMKERIMAWIAYWPISVLIYLLSDFLSAICEQIYRWFSGVYESIAKRLRESFTK